MSLRKLLLTFVLLASTALAAAAEVGAAAATPLQIYFFASSTCDECLQIKQNLLPAVQASYGAKLSVNQIDLDTPAGFELLLSYEQHYDLQDDAAVKLFVGDVALCGNAAIWTKLEATIAAELQRAAVTPSPVQVRAAMAVTPAPPVPAELAEQRFQAFKLSAVVLAGLLDGINPCAFTTLVFLVSLLTSLRKSRRQIMIVGICFAAAVFLTYLGVGLGALTLFKSLAVASGVSRLLTAAVAGFALVLALYSFADFLAYRRTGSAQALRLKLPHGIRVWITRLISTQLRTRNLVVGALSLGVVVSVLESLCTGQVYLPTLAYIVHDRGLASTAFLWLLLYNTMFVLPLLGIFVVVATGVSSARLRAVGNRHLGAVKLAFAMLFLLLAGLLVLTLG